MLDPSLVFQANLNLLYSMERWRLEIVRAFMLPPVALGYAQNSPEQHRYERYIKYPVYLQPVK